MTEETTTLDSKGRILIPEKLRRKARLSSGTRLKVRVEGNDIVQITKSIPPKQFIELTEGILNQSSLAKKADPLKLKEIWAS